MPVPFLRESRATIRRRIGYLLFGRNKFLYGQLSSGGASSIVLPQARRYPDGSLVGRTVYVLTGPGSGQYAVVTGSTQATGTLTVSPAFGAPPDGTSSIELWPELINVDDVNAAIERAILRVSDILNVYVSVAPLSTLYVTGSTTLILALVPPTSLVRLTLLHYIDAGGLWHTYYPAEWQNPDYGETFILAGGSIYITPRVDTSVVQGSFLLRGYRLPALPTSDSDLIEVPSDYCVFYSAAMLDAQMAEGQSMDPEQHSGRAANWLREAAVIEARMGTNWLPNTVELPW